MSSPSERIESIFDEALRRNDPTERAGYLASACVGEHDLLARVQALLDAHENAGSFLRDPAQPDSSAYATVDAGPGANLPLSRLPPADYAEDKPGRTIGPYKLLQKIGEGGFGSVWMADQERPVRRRVALKIIKAGMDTRQVIARFEQERQALALMDHPNIAKVLDAGATATGRPYFVMELVRGVKITEYCDQQSLSPEDRIELFITVCHAVQHAHQKGIIHRDLKPSNILVTVNDGEAVPKVIDFGVAKATQGRLTDGTLFTQFEQMIGTPLYMSPEQAEITSLDVDTRSDVYSLGVLLYELMTGKTPIDTATMARAGMDEIRRLIREVDPPRPSARLRTLEGQDLTTVAKRRHIEPTRLSGFLRGDLDWIVMKCLEKDRKRRYDTANGLAMDLRRHLENEVVVARPPTTAYLMSKLIRRNKLAFIASAAVAASLVVGIAGSIWQAVRAEREAARARSAESRAVASLDELRATAPAFAEQARALVSREQFDEAIAKLDYAIKLRPDVPEYLISKADLLQCQFKLAEAAHMYRAALAVKPGLARAEASAKLCDELLAATPGGQSKLARESLAKLYLAMQGQQRPAAELMPVARLLGEEKKLLVDYWLGRFRDLPVPAERPLKDRLTIRDDGRLALDLSNTKVLDLTPLAGAPLAALNLSSSGGRSELADLSPLRGMDLVELNVSSTSVADLTPLRETHSLGRLDISSTKVKDLSALGALRLKRLRFTGCDVSDLGPIRRMPIEEISLRDTRVADLSPLVGMPVKSIDLSWAPVINFSPLAQLPLERCYLQHNRIVDLSVFRGKAMKELALWGCADARGYAVLAEIKTLELLLLPSEYRRLPNDDYEAIGALRNHPKLRQLGSEIMDQMGYAATGPSELFWQDWDREQTFIPALRKTGVTFSLSKLPTGTYDLRIQNQPLRDISFLRGAPISHLDITGCPIADLSPIQGLPLEKFISNNQVLSDLAPLRGMPLKTIHLQGPAVSDLSPLTGLPLKLLLVGNCPNVTDVAVLADISTLEHLTVPMQAKNIESLRKLPRLKRLGFSHGPTNLPDTTVDEFWNECSWIVRLSEAGVIASRLKRLEDGTWDVDIGNTPLKDLTILSGAAISALRIDTTGVTDLTPLRGMPLKRLEIANNKITDLSPLRGMALEQLRASATGITDLSVLRGMPLKHLWLADTGVTDLSPLRGMRLETLRLHGCVKITDVSPLATCKRLRTVTLPPNVVDIQFLRASPRLERIGFSEAAGGSPDMMAADFWTETGQTWALALRQAGIKYTATRLTVTSPTTAPTTRPGAPPPVIWRVAVNSPKFSDCSAFRGAADVRELIFDNSAVADLAPLRGLALTRLSINHTPVADLEPLRGMPLKELRFFRTKVTDLGPLQGMPIERMNAGGNAIADISALHGMPLIEARFAGCAAVTDMSPLADCKQLEIVTIPPKAENIEVLRALPGLRRLSSSEEPTGGHLPDKTAADFWIGYDAKRNAAGK